MGTLVIGSASNRAGVTIDPRTVLFNENNVKYIKSGLTEIWSNIQPLVPTLTSNIGKDGGEVFYSSAYGELKPFWVFDNSEETAWHSNANEKNTYIGYRFTKPTKANKLSLCYSSGVKPTLDLTLQASNNGSEWFNLVTIDNNKLPTYIDSYGIYNYEVEFDNEQSYMQYRLYSNYGFYGGGNTSWLGIRILQLYGTQLKGLVPNMTSNDGNVLFNDYFAGYYPYLAFSGTNSDQADSWLYQGNGTNVAYIGYKFKAGKKVGAIYIQNRGESSARAIKSFMLQGSDDLETWYNIEEFNVKSSNQKAEQYFTVSNQKTYKAFRVFVTQVYDTSFVGLGMLQFYG